MGRGCTLIHFLEPRKVLSIIHLVILCPQAVRVTGQQSSRMAGGFKESSRTVKGRKHDPSSPELIHGDTSCWLPCGDRGFPQASRCGEGFEWAAVVLRDGPPQPSFKLLWKPPRVSSLPSFSLKG